MDNDEVSHHIDPSLYPNRWIAIVRERVIGVGLTEAQAYRAAMHTRAKDKPRLFFVDAEGNVTPAGIEDE